MAATRGQAENYRSPAALGAAQDHAAAKLPVVGTRNRPEAAVAERVLCGDPRARFHRNNAEVSWSVEQTPTMKFAVATTSIYLSTSSARSRIDGGIVRAKAAAVLRFTTNSKCVGSSTGRSAGLAPFRIFATYIADLR